MAAGYGEAEVVPLSPSGEFPDEAVGSLAKAAIDMRAEREVLDKKHREDGSLDKMKAAVGEAILRNPYVDEQCLLRFLRADLGDVKKASKRLVACLEWREKRKPETAVCPACAADPLAHYVHFIGFDKFGRPALYSCFGLGKEHIVENNIHHLVAVLEDVITKMPPGVENYVWVTDFHGFGMVDCNPKLPLASNEVFGKHYPERVGTYIFVEAPKIFSGLWKQIRVFVDKRTYRKAQFVEGPKKEKGAKLRARLAEIFDEELVDWLMVEMVENRDKKKVKEKLDPKFYSYTAESLERALASSAHDPRGPRSHLQRLLESAQGKGLPRT
eukprot:TRINITY_DN16696_c0_g1_i1.p1 TRINITY_DN16696_c0_g1~~TRINITY_DN16696_c0_g1_i1.p1  ORF type:complete len:328 (-),score=66.47 TRINITY_DN16696_c0_g1_i1:189-1172(-)